MYRNRWHNRSFRAFPINKVIGVVLVNEEIKLKRNRYGKGSLSSCPVFINMRCEPVEANGKFMIAGDINRTLFEQQGFVSLGFSEEIKMPVDNHIACMEIVSHAHSFCDLPGIMWIDIRQLGINLLIFQPRL